MRNNKPFLGTPLFCATGHSLPVSEAVRWGKAVRELRMGQVLMLHEDR